MIIGLDLASSTGVTFFTDPKTWECERWLLKGKPGEKGLRLGRLLRDAILERKPRLVAFEDPVYIPDHKAAVQLRFGLEMMVQVICEQTMVAHVPVNVSDIRSHLLGRGRWKKKDAVEEVRRRTGRHLGEDEADSWAVALFAAEVELAGV